MKKKKYKFIDTASSDVYPLTEERSDGSYWIRRNNELDLTNPSKAFISQLKRHIR